MPELPSELPFRRTGPAVPASPVILSVPHAGRDYSPALLRASRLPREKLEVLEDRLMDRLVWRAVGNGATAIIASRPRAEIDLNRDEREIDPSAVVPTPRASAIIRSPRARGGLGLIPSRIAGSGSIWFQRTPQGELTRRIEEVHRPFHAAIRDMMAKARERFGIAVLLDCHSMPPRPASGDAQVVFGDLFGKSIAPELLGAAMEAAEAEGFTVSLNTPFAGGYVTAQHGRPNEGMHAVQLELDRSIYLDDALRSPGPRFDDAASLLEKVVAALGDAALGRGYSLAAE